MWNPVVTGQLRKPVFTHGDLRPCDPGEGLTGTSNVGYLPCRIEDVLPDQTALHPSDHRNHSQMGSDQPGFGHTGGWGAWRGSCVFIKAWFFPVLYKTRHQQCLLLCGQSSSSIVGWTGESHPAQVEMEKFSTNLFKINFTHPLFVGKGGRACKNAKHGQ